MAADPAQFRLLPVSVNLDVLITVLANRPDLRAAEYRLQASQHRSTRKTQLVSVDYFGRKFGARLPIKRKARSISLC